MFFDLFKSRPLLDEESVQWLFEIYRWALTNFDKKIFFDQTILVVPSNQYFPGEAHTQHEMAQLIFDKVREYAAVKHWPCRLTTDQSCATQTPRVVISGALRDVNGIEPEFVLEEDRLPVLYDPRQVGNPEAIIAAFAHTLAHHLGSMGQTPPGIEENWPQITEVLAVFMGFGLMFSNSAFVYRNVTCGSCQPTTVNRSAYLSQYDITYALAIFCVLKEIKVAEALKNLKKSLRPFFKKAYKDVRKRGEDLQKLRDL
ncbi:MAG: hypothetical protein KZQ83_10535 [gamma proteobacterium symbiont of Taylorina sp.]|nr:hypothetical protein [gamma proteobacterium symbiont of Taylorina sp.]